jgi:SH3 domain protein
MNKLWLLILLTLVAGPSPAQTTRYVTDLLKLEARSGPSTGHRIVRMLESGTEVTVLEESQGYSRVRVPAGEEGWILSRYLMEEPAARSQLEGTVAAYERVRKENETLSTELAQVRNQGQSVATARNTLQQQKQRLTAELAEIRRAAASTLAIEQRNQELQVKVVEMERDLQLSRQENATLSDRRDRDWFVAGAGVLLGGMVLGLVLPRMRWKRRRGWSEI